jgi:hypothetical protein
MEYRKGMWVTVAGRVGILAKPDDRDAYAEIHYTDADGNTVEVVAVPYAHIAQAAFADIPALRRPSESVASALGYI